MQFVLAIWEHSYDILVQVTVYNNDRVHSQAKIIRGSFEPKWHVYPSIFNISKMECEIMLKLRMNRQMEIRFRYVN